MTMTNQHTDSVLIQQMEILKGDNTMTKTPDYNDGNVHWWNSYYKPETLHGKSNVKVSYSGKIVMLLVEEVCWGYVSAFQVIKRHVEPRVWWVNLYPNRSSGGLYKTKEEALKWRTKECGIQTIRLIEQPESDT
jgi:hypothetical protein